MRKPITVILALILALSTVFASAESINMLEQLRSSANKDFGVEAHVYESLYSLLSKANGGNLPLNHWDVASTYISKLGIGEELTPEETIFDQSLSAYEKYFLKVLTDTTLPEEDGKALMTLFNDGAKMLSQADQPLYLASEPETEAFLIGLMRQGVEKMGFHFELEPIDETTSLYAIMDEMNAGVISARKALTSLPAAMLMKHVPADKQAETAAVLKKIESTIPDTINWKSIVNDGDLDFEGEDFGFDDEDGLEAVDDPAPQATPVPELTDEQRDALTAKWLVLVRACQAFDAQGNEETVKQVTDALYALTEERPEVHLQPEGGISLNYPASAATPTPAPTSAASGASATPTPKPAANAIQAPPGYSLPYVVYISKNSYTIAVIGKDSSGQFTKVKGTYPTGIGKAGSTRATETQIYKKERWRSWTNNMYSPYCTRLGSGLHIHGPMYSAKNSYSMIPGSYNEIGTSCSSGCLRTTCKAAKTIYGLCAAGTYVIVANDSRYKAAKPKKIDKNQTYDPTDVGGEGAEALVESIKITPNPVRVKVKASQNLTLDITPANATSSFAYESSNTGIATVDSEGRVTGVKVGKCTVKVTAADAGKESATVDVEVIDESTATTSPTPAPSDSTEPTSTPAPSDSAEPTSTPEPTPTAEPTPTPTPEPTPTPTPVPAEIVKQAQTNLAILCWLEDSDIDGKFGKKTSAAVAEFQRSYNKSLPEGSDKLLENGELNEPTLEVLKKEADNRVAVARTLLAKLGLLADANGGYDNALKAAVKEFQIKVNEKAGVQRLSPTGRLDDATMRDLIGGYLDEDDETEPTAEPSIEPGTEPTAEPSVEPSSEPTSDPTTEPSSEPTSDPTAVPSSEPTSDPTTEPSSGPTSDPTTEPSSGPTSVPSTEPTSDPTAVPEVTEVPGGPEETSSGGSVENTPEATDVPETPEPEPTAQSEEPPVEEAPETPLEQADSSTPDPEA